MSLVAVPGFGFLPQESANILHTQLNSYLVDHNISSLDLPPDLLDDIKCNQILIPRWKQIFPQLVKKGTCPPKWDNASCIPPTLPGETAVLPCMAVYQGRTYSPHYNATRSCSPAGVWAPTTDYNDCMCNSTEPCHEDVNPLEISIIIYLVGYVLSFLALCGAIAIFLSFREMRCLRHKIHVGLFFAFGLSALNWIVTKSLPELAQYFFTVFAQVYCTSWVITFFFHLASFYWMFLEGFYLFLQVQFPLSLVSVKFAHFLLFGCGGPVLNIGVWIALRIIYYDPSNTEDVIENCPFFETNGVDFYVCEIPILLILICNTFFLIWIMVIVVAKLCEKTAMDHDKKHWKAAKALVIVMPILGCGYLVTMVGPDQTTTPWGYTAFQIIRSTVLSTQGLVISLPYCYLNSEVQSVVQSHYTRWQLVRSVGREQAHSHTSITANNSSKGQDGLCVRREKPGQYLTIPTRGRQGSGADNSVMELFIMESDNSNDDTG